MSNPILVEPVLKIINGNIVIFPSIVKVETTLPAGGIRMVNLMSLKVCLKSLS